MPRPSFAICKLAVCALALFSLAARDAVGADNLSTPEPPQADLPYLLMAQDLVPTDAAQAHEDVRNKGKKNEEDTYSVPGEHATARTPLPSPVFVVKADTLDIARFQVYPFELKSGHREITFSPRKTPKPYTLTPKKVSDTVYRLEVDESLPPGEYSLSPNGSNQVFCFSVY